MCLGGQDLKGGEGGAPVVPHRGAAEVRLYFLTLPLKHFILLGPLKATRPTSVGLAAKF